MQKMDIQRANQQRRVQEPRHVNFLDENLDDSSEKLVLVPN